MKSHRKVIDLHTTDREEIVNISREVHEAVKDSTILEGLCLVYPLHTSSAVFLNDSDPSVSLDTADVLRRLVPAAAGYRHDDVDPKENADGHIKQVIVGHHLVLPITEGRLDLGTYQTVYYAEFDGGRVKEVLVKIIGA